MAEKAPSSKPAGMHTLTPHLWFNGNCQEAVAFYQKALGATLTAPVVMGPGGSSVLHAMLAIGDSPFMLADAWPGTWEKGPDGSSTVGLWVYVEDCDALFKRAADAGCETEFEMMDAFWGDRMGKVRDPFGHCWAIATHKLVLTPEEIEEGQQAWLQTLES